MARPPAGGPRLFYPPALAAAYAFGGLLALLVFRAFFPGDFWGHAEEEAFLPLYGASRAAARALLDWTILFPALVTAALVMPFGVNPDYAPAPRRFSPSFLSGLKPSLVTALCAAVIFALLALVFRPLLYAGLDNMRTNSRIFWQSKESAAVYADKEDWVMAAGFLAVCRKIWPGKKAGIEALDDRIRTGREALIYGRPAARPVPVSERGVAGQKQPVDAREALALAETAREEGRLYDAHWLATLATRLSRPGGAEYGAGMRLAARTWERITEPEPDSGERRLASIYRQKRAAYEAMLSADWIRAYFLFNELSLIVPADPDVRAFLEMSREGVREAAFFIGETDGVAGDEIENAVFSLPLPGSGSGAEGRLVIRAGYLSALADSCFISRFEARGFDGENSPRFGVETPFAKCVPIFVNGAWQTLVLLRALDRDDERLRWDPLWTGEGGMETGAYTLVLGIRFEDFLLAAAARDTKGFFLGDFWRAAESLAPYGFAPETFQAEIIRALCEPLLFVPFVIFALLLGWRLRARVRPRFSGIPMALALPPVFNALFAVAQNALSNLCAVILLSSGPIAALVCALLLSALLFIASLFALAAGD